MKKDFNGFTDRHAQIVVFAPHEPETVKAYWQKEDLPFIGVPDPDGQLGKRFGQEWHLFKLGRMPAMLIVDPKGTVIFSQYAKHMADIPENRVVFRILEGLKP